MMSCYEQHAETQIQNQILNSSMNSISQYPSTKPKISEEKAHYNDDELL
jgi:hypothetical protein